MTSIQYLFKECFDRFFIDYVNIYLKYQTQKAYKSFKNTYIVPYLGEKIMSDINFHDLSALHHSLHNKPTTANRILSLLSKFFNWCEIKDIRDKNSNPTKTIKRYYEKPILKFLNQNQMTNIWHTIIKLEYSKKLKELPATALKLLMLTGARKNEILSLKWSDIDIDKSRAILLESKSRFKVLYFPDKAIDIIKLIPKVSEYVFPSKSASGHLFDLQWQWRIVVKEAGLEGRWRIHDLRHGFASAAVNNGGSLPYIGFLLGHKRSSTTERYAHVAENPAQALLNQVARAIMPREPEERAKRRVGRKSDMATKSGRHEAETEPSL
jgi:integrase